MNPRVDRPACTAFVLAALTLSSGSQARFLQSDPVGYQDDLNLYSYVGSDPMNRSDPSGLAGCGSSIPADSQQCKDTLAQQAVTLGKVETAQAAVANLKTERAAVAAGDQKELSAGAKSTEAALVKYFKSSDAKTIKKVEGILSGTARILKDDGTKYNYQAVESNRVAQHFAKKQSDTLAVTHPMLGPNIFLTKLFFSSPSDQAYALSHEPAHMLWVNAFPVHGQKESYGDDIFSLSNSDALNNADNYAQFIMR